MKPLFVFLLSLPTLTISYAQQETGPGTPLKTDYITKSRTNRTVGFVFLAGGAALTAGGIIGSQNSDDLDFSGVVGATVGIGAMLASIPFFIIASHQSAKAAGLSGGIKMERNMNVLNRKYACQTYPTLALRISLP